jgi:hypothetical protein
MARSDTVGAMMVAGGALVLPQTWASMKARTSLRLYRTNRPILTKRDPKPLVRSRSIVRVEHRRIWAYSLCVSRSSTGGLISPRMSAPDMFQRCEAT